MIIIIRTIIIIIIIKIIIMNLEVVDPQPERAASASSPLCALALHSPNFSFYNHDYHNIVMSMMVMMFMMIIRKGGVKQLGSSSFVSFLRQGNIFLGFWSIIMIIRYTHVDEDNVDDDDIDEDDVENHRRPLHVGGVDLLL